MEGQRMEEFSGKHAELTRQIIGVFFAVARELGHGFNESVYRRSMMIGLEECGLRVQEEVAIPVSFHGKHVGTFFADLVVEGKVVLELKRAESIERVFEAQLLHYLRSSRMEVGLVLVFGEKARFKRLSMDNERKPELLRQAAKVKEMGRG